MSTLLIDSSARAGASVSRQLTTKVADQLGDKVIRRDVAEGLPLVSENWIAAAFTPAEDRNDAQNEILATSDALIAELQAADTIVIGAPIYNFGIPASLKSWIDQIARVGVTFRYTAEGPVGLLEGKRAIVVVASGGVPVDAPMDFATPYLRQVLGFIGITDVTVISADQLNMRGDEKVAAATSQINGLAA